jgi:hypothetical protein
MPKRSRRTKDIHKKIKKRAHAHADHRQKTINGHYNNNNNMLRFQLSDRLARQNTWREHYRIPADRCGTIIVVRVFSSSERRSYTYYVGYTLRVFDAAY